MIWSEIKTVRFWQNLATKSCRLLTYYVKVVRFSLKQYLAYSIHTSLPIKLGGKLWNTNLYTWLHGNQALVLKLDREEWEVFLKVFLSVSLRSFTEYKQCSKLCSYGEDFCCCAIRYQQWLTHNTILQSRTNLVQFSMHIVVLLQPWFKSLTVTHLTRQ